MALRHTVKQMSGKANKGRVPVSMSDKPETDQSDKPSVTLPGTVEKVIKPVLPSEPEKAQVAIEGGDDLYREIRIDNTLQNEKGEDVSLKPGVQVEIMVEAEPGHQS